MKMIGEAMGRKEKLLSFIIPVYNGEKYIEECVEHVLRNDGEKGYEIIIINDGSTDSTKRLLDHMESDQIRVYHTENGGVSQARNLGMKQAEGEYVMFVDVDDLISPNCVDYLNNTLEKLGWRPDICMYKRVIYDNAGELDSYMQMEEEPCFEEIWTEHNKVELMRNVLTPEQRYQCDFGGHIWGKAYRKAFLRENEIKFNESMRICEDSEFSLMTMAKAGTVVYNNATNYYYFAGNLDSAVHKWHPEITEYREMIEREKAACFAPYPDLYRELQQSHMNGFISLFVYDFANRGNKDTLFKLRNKIKRAQRGPFFSEVFRMIKIGDLIKMENPPKEKMLLIMSKFKLFMLLAVVSCIAAKRK